MYSFPSRKATTRLRANIKALTSTTNAYKDLDILFKELNYLIRGWSNYFSPAPNQLHLRRALDSYIWKRLRKFVMNKYKHSYHDIFMELFSTEISPDNKSGKGVFYHEKSNTYRVWSKTPAIKNRDITNRTRPVSLELVSLVRLNAPSM